MDLSWVDAESLLVSVAVVKDTAKCDDWMFSDLNVNVSQFMETKKKIFCSTSTSCLNIAATSTPSKSISDVLMNKKKQFS